jgi:hypothetical protein
MPFQSEKQRRYLHANHPEIAKRWEKEYAHGGILDITGDEEITTEEGNDISLVDESETGVSTLFMKKGGRVPFQGGGRDASSDDFGGGTSGGSNQGGDDKSYQSEPREIGIQQAYEVINPAYTKERQREEELDTLVATGPGSPIEKYDTEKQMLQDKFTPNQPGDIRRGNYEINRAQIALDQALANQEAALKKMGLEKLGKMGVMLAAMVGIYKVPFVDAVKALPKTLSIGKADIKSLFKESLPVMKAKYKLTNTLEKYDQKFKEYGMPEYTPHTDTELQKINQQLLDLSETRDEDTDSGPGPISPLPVGGDKSSPVPVEEMEVEYDWLGAVRDKQQKKKEYDEKIARENPIGTETEIIALRNSGGLANLFRVKKQ